MFIRKGYSLDSASRTFYTLINELFSRENDDFGTIFWSEFVQSVSSNSKDAKISCARFLTIMVLHALNHYHMPEMKDYVIIAIPKMQKTMFVTSDPKFFDFVGYIPEVRLERVPSNNDIIKAYKEIPNFGIHEIPVSLQTTLATIDLPKKRRKEKVISY